MRRLNRVDADPTTWWRVKAAAASTLRNAPLGRRAHAGDSGGRAEFYNYYTTSPLLVTVGAMGRVGRAEGGAGPSSRWWAQLYARRDGCACAPT